MTSCSQGQQAEQSDGSDGITTVFEAVRCNSIDDVTDITRVDGLRELWDETHGDPNVCIAVLDGPVDFSHPSLAGARLTQIEFGNRVRNSRRVLSDHGTHVTSIIFGQHDTPVKGIAPDCSGLVIPIFEYAENGSLLPASQEDLAEAIHLAVRLGAKIINISAGQFSKSGKANHALEEAVKSCEGRALIVAAAGNDGCECLHVPGAIPSVLAVGAMSSDGEPLPFSNWGNVYRDQGVLALGENILGASNNGDVVSHSGTSMATAVASGVAALFLCLSQTLGKSITPQQLRETVLANTIGCDVQKAKDCQRLLAGRLNTVGIVDYLRRGAKNVSQLPNNTANANTQAAPTADTVPASVTAQPVSQTNYGVSAAVAAPNAVESSISASDCGCSGQQAKVYVVGQLGYDFESEARKDSIDHAMTPIRALRHHDPKVENPVDFLRHIVGFEEIQIDAAVGGIMKVAAHTGTGNIEITIRQDDPIIINADDWAQIAIGGLCVSYDGGLNYSLAQLNSSIGGRTKIRRTGQRSFYLDGFPHGGFNYKFNEARWVLPRVCASTSRHSGRVHDADATTWTLTRGKNVLYALKPVGAYSEEAIQEIVGFLMEQHGLTNKGLNYYYYMSCGENVPWEEQWDPCFNDLRQVAQADRQNNRSDDLTTPRSEAIAVPGLTTGQATTRTGFVVPSVDPDMRGTANWSREALMFRIQTEVYRGTLTPAQIDKLDRKIGELLDRLDEEVRNSGLAADERALNFAATQHISMLRHVVDNLLGDFQVEAVLPPQRHDHCREGSDCWDVEVSFFNPDNINEAPVVVRQSVDVSDTVPVSIEDTRRFRRR